MVRQPALFPTFRYHAFITDHEGTAVFLDADHRRHALVEIALRDLKEGSGLAHCSSGDFHSNGAWAVLAKFAHNILRWVAALRLEINGESSRRRSAAASSPCRAASRVARDAASSAFRLFALPTSRSRGATMATGSPSMESTRLTLRRGRSHRSAPQVQAWFRDDDFDGEVFRVSQAFFPVTDAWTKLSRALKGTVDAELLEDLHG
jgi:hypothetical protein